MELHTGQAQLRDYAIEVAYVGNKANKLMANRNINQPLPGAGSVNSKAHFPRLGRHHLPRATLADNRDIQLALRLIW